MRSNCILVLVLVFILFITGCANIIVDSSKAAEKNIQESTENVKINSNSDSEKYIGVKNTQLIDANQKFSWEIFNKINEEDSDKEIFISPLSVSSMLMMAYNGAEGTTMEAMAKAMYYEGITIDDLNKGYKHLISRLNNIDKKVNVEIANSIWSRQGFEIRQHFTDVNRNYLLADVSSLDFAKADAANEINNWVAKKTNNLIPSIINPPIADDVMLYLINAIYFKGEWTNAFKSKDTFEADFYSYDGLTDKVQMMHRKGCIDLAQTEGYMAVSLPYGDERVSMMVILPKGDINEFIYSFDHDKWNEMLSNLRQTSDLHLQLPKFKMEYGTKNLTKSLTSLGMGELFTGQANFSGISEGLFISKVLHKAVIDVNEKGTEAAAVTVGEFTTSYTKPVEFIANRPFIFVIYDTEEGNILFIGKKLFGER